MTFTWSPRHAHVTQMRRNPDGTITGRNDCFEAAYARYLFETLAPARCPAGDSTLIDEVAQIARGVPDTPWNDPTTLPECERAFAHYRTPFQWTASFQAARAAAFGICLVDGTALRPAQYPANWFSDPGEANHFVLWLPYWQGCDGWFDDPLVMDGDCRYDLASVQSAFTGAYLLPALAVAVDPTRLVLRRCALKVQPNHTCAALSMLDRSQRVIELAHSGGWTRVNAGAHTGYVPSELLGRPAA
jgi:hypothetical protein